MKNTRKNSIMYKNNRPQTRTVKCEVYATYGQSFFTVNSKSSCFPLQGFVTIFNITYGGGHVNCEL